MIRVQLPPVEADRLDTLFRVTDNFKLRVRLQIVLMAHRGVPARTSPPTSASTARPSPAGSTPTATPGTHNRLFATLADLKTSLRASLSYFQTVRHTVKSLIEGRPKRKTTK